MKVLVIGGSNFIGWRLIKELSKVESDVVVINRGNHIRQYPENVKHIIGDRMDASLFEKILDENTFDIVYDMCGFKALQLVHLIPLFTGKTKRYVFISSSAAYLDNQVLPLKENAKCGFHPQWGVYGEGKYSCEQVLLEAYNKNGFPVTIIRPSYVYGIGNPIDRETLLFDRIEKDRPILIPYSGYGVIQLGEVGDLCSGLIKLAFSDKGIGEVFNISGKEYVTLNTLVSLIADIIGKEAKCVHIHPEDYGFAQRDLFPFENNTYFTDISKFSSLFSWGPKKNLREGLTEAYLAWKNSEEKIATKYEKEDAVISELKKKGII